VLKRISLSYQEVGFVETLVAFISCCGGKRSSRNMLSTPYPGSADDLVSSSLGSYYKKKLIDL
jgi:hypothetical protein